MSVVESNGLVGRLAPVVKYNAGNQARPGLECHLVQLLEHLGVNVLEHRRHDVLLEWRQVLRHLAVDGIVLLPQLQEERRRGKGWGRSAFSARRAASAHLIVPS